MIKQTVILEIIKDDRIYSLSLPQNANFGELYDVLFEMKNFVVDKINKSSIEKKPKEPLKSE